METSLKLNLGSGNKPLDGFVNVDLEDADLIHDIREPLPFKENRADEIHGYHIIEHFLPWEAPAVLADWFRVLKPGGLLVLECPCLDKIVRHIAHHAIEGKLPPPPIMWGLYGDPRYKNEYMLHRWCYSVGELAGILQSVGFEEIEDSKAQTHVPERDFRITGRKPWQPATPA